MSDTTTHPATEVPGGLWPGAPVLVDSGHGPLRAVVVGPDPDGYLVATVHGVGVAAPASLRPWW